MIKTILKRTIAVIGMIAAFLTFYFSGIVALNDAVTGVELTKAILFTIIGGFGFFAFFDDFRENKWPFEG